MNAPAHHPAPIAAMPVTAQHIPPMANLLADAFEVDAAYRYLFPDPMARPAGLRDFFHGNLQTHLPHACTHVAVDHSGAPLGTVTLRPPGGIPLPPRIMLRRMTPFALRQGLGAVRRLLWLKDMYEALNDELADGGPHWYVHMMAVDPSTQGQGLGTALLDRVMDDTVRTTTDIPTVLTTHLERNLGFYTRMGFETIWERQLNPPGAQPYTVWGMARSPS